MKLSADTSDFLSTLLQLADTGERETRHIKDWTIHQFHPEFVQAVDAFLSGFRAYCSDLRDKVDEMRGKYSDAALDIDEDARGCFGCDVFLSLSGHGAGFWDSTETKAVQVALEAYAGSKYRFEGLESNLAKFSGRIHLAYRTAAYRREALAKLFTPAAGLPVSA